MILWAFCSFSCYISARGEQIPPKRNEHIEHAKHSHVKKRGLIKTALRDKVRLELNEEQEIELNNALQLIHELRTLERQDTHLSLKDSISYIDHAYTINILSSKQFRRVVDLTYTDLVEDANRIWAQIDSAQMTKDLNLDVAMFQIQQYLLDLRVAEEIYWNDKTLREKARHQIKVYAPQVIKRYFATRPKKKENNRPKDVELINFNW